MKEYYIIHYYDPTDGYSTDPTLYLSTMARQYDKV